MARKARTGTDTAPPRDATGKLILAADRQAWEKHDGESAAAYAAFLAFAQMPARSRALNRLDSAALGLTTITIRSYSSDNRWAERAAEWDRVKNAKDLDELEAQRRRLLSERRGIALGFQSVAGQVLRRKLEDFQRRLQDPEDNLRDIKLRELSLMMRDVDSFERRAFDEPDQTIGFVPVAEDTGEAVLASPNARIDLFAAIRERVGVRDPLAEPGGPITDP